MAIDIGEGAKTVVIPLGKLEAPDNNAHRIIQQDLTINGRRRRVELIHQVRAGDCVLANFLNTSSLESACDFNVDGKLPMTISEARQAAINLRRRVGEDVRDIMAPDSPLEYIDTIRLFSTIHGVPARQEDILTIDGTNKTFAQLRLDALNIMDYLDTYTSGLCTTGLGYHSRSIKKLQGDSYAVIDPMDPNGLRVVNTAQLMDFFVTHMGGQTANNNFFYFVRK